MWRCLTASCWWRHDPERPAGPARVAVGESRLGTVEPDLDGFRCPSPRGAPFVPKRATTFRWRGRSRPLCRGRLWPGGPCRRTPSLRRDRKPLAPLAGSSRRSERIGSTPRFLPGAPGSVWFHDIVHTCLAASCTPQDEGVGDVAGEAGGPVKAGGSCRGAGRRILACGSEGPLTWGSRKCPRQESNLRHTV